MSRELDDEVAKKVMPPPPPDSAQWALEQPPPYSTEIAEAWRIIELTSGDAHGWFWSIRNGIGSEADWAVQITGVDFGRVQADANTAPEAICRAALLAVGVTPP